MSIRKLLSVPVARRNIDWLKDSLRAAIQLEFATIPPYLTAMWSIQDASDPVALSIKEVVMEEMAHMGLACNLLVGLAESPVLEHPDFVPPYPAPLPGEVNPTLMVPLKRLTPSQLKVFMDIEYPEGGPITPLAAPFDTIGAFYEALLQRFEALDPPLDLTKQRSEPISGVFTMADLNDVRRGIGLIRLQGEGSKASPEETPGDLAHYYRFREVYVGAKYIKDPKTMTWGHTGAPVVMPAVYPMAEIPRGGYQRGDVPDATVWALVEEFDQTFRATLHDLQRAWEDPTVSLDDAIAHMYTLTTLATGLMQKSRPDGKGMYGPSFRVV